MRDTRRYKGRIVGKVDIWKKKKKTQRQVKILMYAAMYINADFFIVVK